jgi:hypothetical protein
MVLAVMALAVMALEGTAAAEQPWLALCAKCLSPTVLESSGLGTGHATAVARITREGATGWCENWRPDDVAGCVREQMASEAAQATYRASADCLHGRITAIDGVSYRLAGVWTSDVGRGRTKWRDPSGRVVGQDNASGGLGISQQWEVLCPRAPARPAAAGVVPRGPAQEGMPATPFRVGQEIEAKYGRDWVRGRVTKIWPHEGRNREPAYDVRLVNGKRGIVPARMLRAVDGAR